MQISYETNELNERVKVTVMDSGTVIRELDIDRPIPDAIDQPQDWWVYVGPFKDRLGMDAPAIAASTHDACKGVMAMLSDRKYVDLKGDKAAMMLDILIATNQPTANPIFPGSGPMTAEKKAAILGTKPTDEERYKGAA